MSGTFASFNTRAERAALPPGRHGRRQRQHRQRRRPRATPAAASSARPSARRPQPAMWSRYDGRRRRRPRRRRSTGWSTRSSTPAPVASTATSPTSTPAQATLERVEAGLGEPGDERRRRGPGGLPAGLARPRQQPGLRRRPQPGARPRRTRWPTRSRAQARNVEHRGGRPAHPRCSTDVGEVNTLAADLAATNRSIAAAQAQRHRRRHPARPARPAGAAAVRADRRPWPRQTPDGGLDVTVGGVAAGHRRHAPARLEIAGGVTPTAPPTAARSPSPSPTRRHRRRRSAAARRDRRRRRAAQRHPPGYRAGPRRGRPARWPTRSTPSTQPATTPPAPPGSRSSRYDPPTPAGPLGVADHRRRPTSPPPASAAAPTRRRQRHRDRRRARGRRGAYQRLVNGFGTEVASVRRLAANQQTLTAPGRRLPRAARRASTSTRRW